MLGGKIQGAKSHKNKWPRQSSAPPERGGVEAVPPSPVLKSTTVATPITLELMRDPVQTILGRLTSDRPSRTGSRHTRRIL